MRLPWECVLLTFSLTLLKPVFCELQRPTISVTSRTSLSPAPSGNSACISMVISTLDPTKRVRCCTTSSAMRPASRPRRKVSTETEA